MQRVSLNSFIEGKLVHEAPTFTTNRYQFQGLKFPIMLDYSMVAVVLPTEQPQHLIPGHHLPQSKWRRDTNQGVLELSYV